MLRRIRAFLTAVMIAATLMLPGAVRGASNIPNADIGDHGTWLTEHNTEILCDQISGDINKFQSTFQRQVVSDYVPIEAKVGMAFMNAMTHIGRVLDKTLIRFMNIFILIAYAFWIAFESYNMISGKGNVPKTVGDIMKKGVMIAIWLTVLHIGVGRIFMWLVGPIIMAGTFMSDFILNAISSNISVTLPDTCAAIREYAASHTAPDMLIDATAAANIMCVPTRLSGFFYTGVAIGWKWIQAGIGHSTITFAIGVTFVILFMWNIWKFALIALSVIADMFLAIFMLPFTAVAETIGQTNYKGIAGTIFNNFMGLFNAKSLSLESQIMRFINAALYFVSLSIVVGLCATIMAGFITFDLSADVPTIEHMGFMTTLLVGFLVWYLASRSADIVKGLAGGIDTSANNPGQKFGKDIVGLARAGYKQYKEWAKAIKESNNT